MSFAAGGAQTKKMSFVFKHVHMSSFYCGEIRTYTHTHAHIPFILRLRKFSKFSANLCTALHRRSEHRSAQKIRGRKPKNSLLVRYLCKSTFTWVQLSRNLVSDGPLDGSWPGRADFDWILSIRWQRAYRGWKFGKFWQVQLESAWRVFGNA